MFVTCDPTLPRGERTFERQFRTECVRPPGPLTDASDLLFQGGAGDGTLDAWTNLGYINHDLTLFKNFRINGGRNFQVRDRGLQPVQHRAVAGCGHGRHVQLSRPANRPIRTLERSPGCAPVRSASSSSASDSRSDVREVPAAAHRLAAAGNAPSSFSRRAVRPSGFMKITMRIRTWLAVALLRDQASRCWRPIT